MVKLPADPELRPFEKLLSGKRAIPYRPVLVQLTGDIPSAILLQQVMFRWTCRRRYRRFYKFQHPAPKHKLYSIGDSWIEELGFTEQMFRSALRRIATRTTASNKGDVLGDVKARFGPSPDRRKTLSTRPVLLNANRLVVYWLDPGHASHFLLNEPLLTDALDRVLKGVSLEI